MNKRAHSIRFLLYFALVCGYAPATCAAGPDPVTTYASRTIRIVAGFPHGGPTDQVVHEIARPLSQAWGQPVIVEYKPGASSRLAFDHVAGAEPDSGIPS